MTRSSPSPTDPPGPGTGTGTLLGKVFRINVEQRSREEIEAVAEGAALMQEQHARDLLSLAETARVRRRDARLQRAREVLERLR